MKTLNKTLSLVLALVMVFSLFGVASAAKLDDFTDKDEITKTGDYKEAIDYLTAAGVVAGSTATTINPKGDFTREQAAKLVAYAALGQNAADAMKASTAPFTDVAADRWSAGYIAYCASAGIINGTGDGSFAPEAKVTGYQLGKMLLCALGYGVNNEFVGPNWKLEVAKYGLAQKIFEGNTAGCSDAEANREEAFLYTFNTLTNTMLVKYNDSLKVYYAGTNPFEGDQKLTRDYTIGYQRFKMEAKVDDGSYSEDAHYWAIDGKSVTDTYSDDPIVKLASSTDGTPWDNLTTKGKTEYIGYSANDTIAYYRNGNVKTAKVDTDAVQAAASVKGNEISFYDTDKDGKYDTVEVLVYNAVKLESDPVITTGGDHKVVTISDIPSLSKVVDDNVKGDDFSTFKKGDYILYYSNDAKTKFHVYKCETITGQMFGYNEGASQININGTAYPISAIAPDTVAERVADLKEVAGLANTTFYLDKGKNVVAATPTESVVAAANVVFVMDSDDAAVGHAVTAQLLKADGSTVIKTISKVTTGNTSKTATALLVAENRFFTYTENTDGSYNLKTIAIGDSTTEAHQFIKADYDNADEAVFTKGTAKFFTDTTPAAVDTLGTSKTVFVLENSGTNTKLTYKAYTGISNVPSVTSYDYSGTSYATDDDSPIAAVLNDKDGYAIMAVALRGKLDTTTTALDYVFVGSSVSSVTMTPNTAEKYYQYPIAAVNGEIKAFESTDNVAINPGLYPVNAYDSNRVDSLVAQGDYANTRMSAMYLMNLLDPVNIQDDPNLDDAVEAYCASHDIPYVADGFTVNGDTVKYTDANGAAHEFVASSDCKVFLHDCTTYGSTNKLTLDKMSGISALEGLAKTKAANGDYYLYGINALRVANKDSENDTVTELYITAYPEAYAKAVAGVVAGGGTVSTVDYLVTPAADQSLTVNYYTGKDHDAATIVAVIQSALEKDGYTVNKVTLSSSTYTFDTKKGVVETAFTWDASSSSKLVESVKVNVDGKDLLLDKTTNYDELGDAPGSFIKIGATATAAATATPVAADSTEIAAQDGKFILTGYYSAPNNITPADGASVTVVAGTAITNLYYKTGDTITYNVKYHTSGVGIDAAAKLTLTVDGSATGAVPGAIVSIASGANIALASPTETTMTVKMGTANITTVTVTAAAA